MPPGIEEDDYDSERDILILKELLSNNSLSIPENESFHFDIPSFSRPPAKPPDGNTRILNVKMMGDIFEQKVPMRRLMSTLVPNQEKSPDLLSHLGLEAFQPFVECPMMIHGKNTPILDVDLTARVDSFEDEQSLGKDASKQGRKTNDIDADEDMTLVNDQDDAKMFDVNDLHGEEVFVEKKVVNKEVSATGEVNDASIATTVSAVATITTEEITLAQALVEIKTSKPKAKGIVLQEPTFKRVNTFKDFRTELVQGQDKEKKAGEELTQESGKKQKMDDDKETVELKQLIKIIPDEEEILTEKTWKACTACTYTYRYAEQEASG
nr:hypothetical protein [Tanacetum cinerariifolium]